MKKLCILPVLLCLCACDNNTITGKCLPNERTVSNTEQNGQNVKTSTTESFLCGCFKDTKSEMPDFMIPKDEFSFKISNTETVSEIQDSVEYTVHTTTETISNTATAKTANKSCNRDCTKLCKHR